MWPIFIFLRFSIHYLAAKVRKKPLPLHLIHLFNWIEIMKKRLFSIALCLTFILSATSVSAQDAAYREALSEMLEASGAMTTVKSMVPQMIGMMKHTYSNVPDEFWKSFEEQLSEKANTQFLDIYVSIYHRYLTISDLKKITAFYESPVGKKLAESTPVMTAEAMEAGQQIGMGIAKEIMANLKEKGYVQ
jgi:hypothetical protein bfra3_22875